jgi:hypothetical protein
MPSLTDTLCTRCGLCCDGTLFADVELAGRAESAGLEILGLQVEDDDARRVVLVQPCAALAGRRCSIYAHRPKCCRTFECRLLQDVRRGAVSVERAQQHISDAVSRMARAEALLVQLGQPARHLPLKERCAEALVDETGGGAELNRKRAELEAAMSGIERLIRATFLS